MYLPDSIGLGNLAMLHLSSPVRRIEQSSEGVQVFTDQLTVEARRVIVATPLFLASRIDYQPALPAAQMQLLRRMVSGSIVRGITIYDEPFWRSDGLSGMSVASDLPLPVSARPIASFRKATHSQ